LFKSALFAIITFVAWLKNSWNDLIVFIDRQLTMKPFVYVYVAIF